MSEKTETKIPSFTEQVYGSDLRSQDDAMQAWKALQIRESVNRYLAGLQFRQAHPADKGPVGICAF